MIDSKARQEIEHRLKQVEIDENVKILMAIESGSRAWGFASPNSDYDVRFIYVRPRDWYLSIDVEDRRDVIEYPIVDDIDLNGWDIRKALRLFWKSNPSFIEWIQSPITYIESGNFRQNVIELLPKIYSVEKGMYHYLNMAKSNYREHMKEKNVRIKKYFYVLRALLNIRWLETNQTVAPIEFERLLTLLEDEELLSTIRALLARKKVVSEKGLGPAVPLINNFIEKEIERYQSRGFESLQSERDTVDLNILFQQVLGESEKNL